MSRKLQITNREFDYPEVGDSNWGEDATDWAEAVTEALANVIGPFDILETPAPLQENQTNQDINQLIFDTSSVKQAIVEGFIVRTFTGNDGVDPVSGTISEAFISECVFDGNAFIVSTRYVGGETGIIIDANSSGGNPGQFTYTSKSDVDMATDLGWASFITTDFTIKFRGKAITNV